MLSISQTKDDSNVMGGECVFTTNREEIASSRLGYYPTIHSLYSMIPRETREHMDRVGRYANAFYQFLNEYYPEILGDEFDEDFFQNSEDIFRYHDIGRIYIPFSVLNKVEKLTDEEFQIIKDHAANARKAIDSIYKKPYSRHLMEQLEKIAVYHHERWDGGGYPERLSGTDIPIGARICAIADTYDGIRSWKPYKKVQTTREQAIGIITQESGKQFDPELVNLFRISAI